MLYLTCWSIYDLTLSLFLCSLSLPKPTAGQGNPSSLNTPITASGERHCDVIEEVVSQLRQELPDSSLNDHIPQELLGPMGFLRVLAYVETQDGLDYEVNKGGLWKVNTSLFDGGDCETTLYSLGILTSENQEILSLRLGHITVDTFNGPLYSAVGTLISLLCIRSAQQKDRPSTSTTYQVYTTTIGPTL